MPTLKGLVEQVRTKGCLIICNKDICQACGYKRLDGNTVPKIEQKLEKKKLGCGSEIEHNKDEYVLLYDNREDSNVRKLLELANAVSNGALCITSDGPKVVMPQPANALRKASVAAAQDLKDWSLP